VAVTADPAVHDDVAAALAAFMGAFDEHDWAELATCLAPEVRTDYRDLRGTPPAVESNADYAQTRRTALDHLDLQHNLTNLVVHAVGPEEVVARANFQIYRFARDGDGHFHSWGTYEFTLRLSGDRWLVAAITQRVLHHDGDPSLHRRP
jgi:SnoaL-like domain